MCERAVFMVQYVASFVLVFNIFLPQVFHPMKIWVAERLPE